MVSSVSGLSQAWATQIGESQSHGPTASNTDVEAAQNALSTNGEGLANSNPNRGISRLVKAASTLALALSGGYAAHRALHGANHQPARNLQETPTCPEGKYYATRAHLQHVKNQMRNAVIGLSVGEAVLVGLCGTAFRQGDLGIYVSVFSGLASVVNIVVPILMTEVGRRYHGKLIKDLGDADGACVQSWSRYCREKTNTE